MAGAEGEAITAWGKEKGALELTCAFSPVWHSVRERAQYYIIYTCYGVSLTKHLHFAYA